MLCGCSVHLPYNKLPSKAGKLINLCMIEACSAQNFLRFFVIPMLVHICLLESPRDLGRGVSTDLASISLTASIYTVRLSVPNRYRLLSRDSITSCFWYAVALSFTIWLRIIAQYKRLSCSIYYTHISNYSEVPQGLPGETEDSGRCAS